LADPCKLSNPLPSQVFLTKGDNNLFDDVSLYPGDRTLVSQEEVIGFVRGYMPLLGWIVIGFQDVYWLRYLTVVGTTVFYLF
jgi:signal peptidase I